MGQLVTRKVNSIEEAQQQAMMIDEKAGHTETTFAAIARIKGRYYVQALSVAADSGFPNQQIDTLDEAIETARQQGYDVAFVINQ